MKLLEIKSLREKKKLLVKLMITTEKMSYKVWIKGNAFSIKLQSKGHRPQERYNSSKKTRTFYVCSA